MTPPTGPTTASIIIELLAIMKEHGDLPVHFRERSGPDAWWVNETDKPIVVCVKTKDSLDHYEVVL